MDSLKLAWSNLKFILKNSDTLALRLALAFGSAMWAFWVLFALLPYPVFAKLDNSFPTPTTTLWLWGILFAMHAISLCTTVLLRWSDYIIDAATSVLGVILWTGSLLIILAVRLNEGSWPMGGALWSGMFMSWWEFAKMLTRNRK